MKVRETDLPGVGKRYTLELQSGWEITLIIHNTGRREIYIMEPEEEEPKCVLSLTDDEAKELGFLLAGTTYQSVSPEKMEFIMREMVMEWVKVGKNSNLVNKTLVNTQIRERTGTSILAILRGKDMIVNPDPHKTVINEGDILVVVGTREQINKFLKYCGDCTH